jgi:chemotaxis protein MotB
MSAHGGGGSERWLVSYADFITLLMVLFVVLYAMGQTDIQRYKQLADSLRVAFSGGGAEQVVSSGIDQAGGAKDKSPAPIVIPGIPSSPTSSMEVAGELTNLLRSTNLGGSVSVQNNIEGVLISLSEKLVFTPGTAQLQPEAYSVLDTIVEMISALTNDIRITGYTDNTPSTDPRYLTNWELSLARAMVIANYFQSAGIAPERMTVSGRGEYKPLFPNDTPEHRALNSRAEIVIIYAVGSDVVNLQNNTSTTTDTTIPPDSGEQPQP